MKITIQELISMHQTAKDLENAVNDERAGCSASTKAEAASIVNFFERILKNTNVKLM